jgi:hypothetical protein
VPTKENEMNRQIVWLLAVLFLALAGPLGARPPEKKAVVADTPEKFELVVQTVRQEMAPGKRYEFLGQSDRQIVNDSLDRMAGMLEKAGSVDAMSQEEKTQLFSIQERVNGLLARNADDRLVCEHVAPVGSHIPTTTCHTVRELAVSRSNSRDQFSDMDNKAKAESARIRTGTGNNHREL